MNLLLRAALLASTLLCVAELTADPATEARDLHRRARERERAGNADAALEDYRSALERDPGLVDAHRDYQNLMRALGRLDEARQEYAARLEREPEGAIWLYLHGRLLDPAGRRAAFGRAVERDPDFFWAVFGLAQDHLARGDWPAAADGFRRAAEIAPASVDSWLGLGEARHAAKRLAEALEAFRRAAAIDPANAAAHLGAGRCLKAMARWPEALAEAEAVLAAHGESLDALELAVQVLHGAGDFDRAAGFRRRAEAAWTATSPEWRRRSGSFGIVIDVFPAGDGFVIAREDFSTQPASFRFDLRGDAAGQSDAPRATFRFAPGAGLFEGESTSGTALWVPEATADYRTVRRRVETMGAERLRGGS